MKGLGSLALFFAATLCTSAEMPTLTTDPVSAVRAVLPPGWTILKVQEDTYPSYRPKGSGKAIFLGISGKKYLKQQFSAALYIMPAGYQDGGEDPTQGKAASWPARLVATTKTAKVYLWPASEVENWKTMQRDLLEALCKKQRTIPSSEREPAVSLKERFNIIAGRLPALTCSLVAKLHYCQA